MIAEFTTTGALPPGQHEATFGEIELAYCQNAHRRILFEGLCKGAKILKKYGCKELFLGGSFITRKPYPGDFDACWNHEGVDLPNLRNAYPIFWDFRNGRLNQLKAFGGEFFLSEMIETKSGKRFREFFQLDKDSGQPVGIVKINLRKWHD